MDGNSSSSVPRKNPLVSRLYSEGMTSSRRTAGGRPVTLSLSRSLPTLRKTHELVVQHNLKKKDNIAYTGYLHQALQQSTSPVRGRGEAKEVEQVASVDRSSSIVDSSVFSEKPFTTFLDSIDLTPKERFDLQHVPHFFIYLRLKQTDNSFESTPRSVYSLETVSQDKVDRNAYFTMSKEGITQFSKDYSHFTPFAQWEREYKIFHRMSHIRFFKRYKHWKVNTSESHEVSFPLYVL